MIKVLIADDHPVVRQGLKQILAEANDIRVTAEAGSGAEVLSVIQQTPLDVMIMDFSMPGLSGLDLLKQCNIEKPGLPVLILSVHSEQQYALRTIKAGACGYLSKSSAPEELVTAIRKLASGGKYLSSTLMEQIATEIQSPGDLQTPHKTLSDREFEVLRLIASGKTTQQIATTLCISPKTVSTYRTRVLAKMKLKNNAELMHYAFEHQLTE